jgi:hypothetical protein
MIQPAVAAAFTALGALVQGLAVEIGAEFLQRQWKHKQFKGLAASSARRLLDSAAVDVVEMLRQELRGVPEHEVRAALQAVRDSLEAVVPLEFSDVLAVGFRERDIEAYVRTRSVHVRQAARLSAAGDDVYDRILSTTCRQIVKALERVRGFEKAVTIQIHRDVDDVRRMVEQMLEILERQRPPASVPGDVERRYLDHIRKTLGGLELFGVGRGRGPRTYPFEQAYVSLAVARSGRRPVGEDPDELTGAGIDVAAGMADHRRVLLRGDAGSGKTTLLRWLAVSAGEDPHQIAAWGPTVPFFVRLRDFRTGSLPNPEQLPAAVAGVIAAEMPPGWATTQCLEGRALLLVDGVDELEQARRPDVREWLRQMVAAYPDIRVVVSARPFAIDGNWLEESGFVTFDLLPLSQEGIERFLGVWHQAARDEHDAESDMQAWLAECEHRLAKLVKVRVELRRLAGNPFLCGLLCALHQDRRMHLPRDRKGLYDAALDWLLERWDEERGLQVEDQPALSKEEQTVILQRLAYSLVKNHELVVPRVEAAARIRHAMRGLRSQDVQDDRAARGALERGVFQRTLERTGLLREPSPEQVTFVHRTFRDFLAGKEVVDSRDFTLLVDHAHLDDWHDVVVSAVAHARPDERSALLENLLRGNEAARHDPRLGSRLELLAAACLPHADVLDGDTSRGTREMVQQAAQRLIPPTSLDEAEALARAGSFVLDLLPGPGGLTSQQAACVVRTAAMIGSEGVREKLAEFVPFGESLVVDELMRAWRRSDDPESYARTVLADVDFGDRRAEVRGWRRVKCLPYLKHLTDVVCYGDIGDLRPLAEVPKLHRLELVQNESIRDLTPLTGSRSLRVLRLTTGCQFLEDLSPLADTLVDELGLYLVKSVDLASLRGTRLHRLVIRDQGIEAGLHTLPEDLPLREIVIDNLPRYRNLRGIDRWPTLEHVVIKGVPRPDEIDALATLPALRHIVIHGPDIVADLPRLTLLPALRRLDVNDVPAPEVDAVWSVLQAVTNVEVRVNDRLTSARRGTATARLPTAGLPAR